MVTVSMPASPLAIKLPTREILRFTVSAALCVGATLTVKLAGVPSVTGEVPRTTLTTGRLASSSMIWKLGAPEPVAPPERLAAPSVPRLSAIFSSLSSLVSPRALKVSVAAREAPAPPVKVMVIGLLVVAL